MIELKDTRTKQLYVFEGRLLGKCSGMELGNRPRWTDVEIYKTDTGLYPVAKRGMSKIFHRVEGGCINKSGKPMGEVTSFNNLTDDHVECTRCRPEDDLDVQQVRLEENFTTIIVCDSPAEVSRAMRLDSRVPIIAQRAYDRAQKVAPELEPYNPSKAVLL